jgi:hypothetical protein
MDLIMRLLDDIDTGIPISAAATAHLVLEVADLGHLTAPMNIHQGRITFPLLFILNTIATSS